MFVINLSPVLDHNADHNLNHNQQCSAVSLQLPTSPVSGLRNSIRLSLRRGHSATAFSRRFAWFRIPKEAHLVFELTPFLESDPP